MRKFALAALLLFVPILGFCQSPGFEGRMDSLLVYLQQQNRFSGAVCLQKGNAVVYENELNSHSNGTHLYRIGSITKVFTAIIVYQLIDAGKLSLDTRLAQFFPKIPHAQDITLSQMLSHSSGIYNITDLKDYYEARKLRFNRPEVLKMIQSVKPAFKPGEDCSYSNSNYILLGYMIEDITQKSFAENLQERIAGPLNLSQTYNEDGKSDRSKREQSFLFNGENWLPDVDSDPVLPGAAGAMISTPRDLCVMMRELFQGDIISDSSLAMLQKKRSKSICHGLFLAPFYDRMGYGHTGRIDEFRSFAFYFPEDSLAVAITTNGLTMNLNDLIIDVLSTYYGMEFSFPKATVPDVAAPDLSKCHGDYKIKFLAFFTVAKFHIGPAGKDYLWMGSQENYAGNEKALLEPLNGYMFHSLENGGKIMFEENKRGKVKKATIYQGKMAMPCRKMLSRKPQLD